MASFLTVALGGRGDRPLDVLWFMAPRLAGVAAVITVAAVLQHRPGGEDIAPAVTAVALAGVSVLASWAVPLGLASVLLAASLALPVSWGGAIGPTLRQAALQANRQLGHVESMFSWVVLALLLSPLTLQVGAVALLVGFGPVLVDYLGWRRLQRASAPTGEGSRTADPSRAELSRTRRPLFYLATLLAQLTFFALAPRQFPSIAPLVIAVMAGICARAFAFWRWARHDDDGQRRAAENGRRLDHAVLAVALGIAAFLSLEAGLAVAAGQSDSARRACRWVSCAATPAPADLALFIVADTQLHALDGAPSGFQVGLVDSVVPVALRPVELDMLSGATLRHFAAVFRAMKAERETLEWVHLGDVADVGCQSEIEAFAEHAAHFGARPLAVAPGNHDLTFEGNVFWHPEWTPACRGRRASRGWTLAQLRQLQGQDPRRVASDEERFAAAVVTLGTVATHKVVGAFLDTTDYGVPDLGIAGARGSVSSRQADWILAHLDPAANVVLFLHHPVEELSPRGQQGIARLRTALAERLLLIVAAHTHVAAWRAPPGAGGSALAPPRAWVAPELVVGSTLDPPQEAAVLRIGQTNGNVWASVRTIAAVQRTGGQAPARRESTAADGLVCARDPGAVTAASCRRLVGILRDPARSPACAGLFTDDGASFRKALARSAPCSSCLDLPLEGDELPAPPQGMDRACGLRSRLSRASDRAMFDWLGDRSTQLQCSRQRRAWELLRCVSGDVDGERTPALPLDAADLPRRLADLYPEGASLDADALARRETLVCLGWAGSVLQGHKREGWTFGRALELAFEDSAAFGELSVTSSPHDGPIGPLSCR